MARFSPDEVAVKHANRLKAAMDDMRKGVERVTTAPTAQAAAAQDKMKTKLNEAIDSGRWSKNLRAVSLEDWRSKMTSKGIPRVAAGIDAARDKQVDFYGKLLPAIDAAKSKIASMPSVTLDDNINRMTTYIREMAKFKK
jgi:hypothetical protein